MRKKKAVGQIWTKKKAALYVRVSTRYQVDKDSLPFQRKKLKEYCNLIGLDDYQIFEDDGYSAKNTDRPNLQDMMARVRSGEFSHVIVWKIDRISRNLLDFAEMYEELKAHRVTFISMNEQFDTSTAIGEAMLKIILVFAELERNMTSERVTGIMLDRAENGLWNGSRMPIGYRWNAETKFPEPDPNEVPIVQMIFDMYENNHSSTKVMRYLVSHKIKSKRGGTWTSKLVHDIIRNPFYIGTYRYNMRESGRGPLKPESEWIIRENNHPGIIEKDKFERCNKIMDANAATREACGEGKAFFVHTFSGKLVCSKCGSNMIASKDRVRDNGFRPSVYRCGKRGRTMDCDNSKIAGENYLGPFVLNYAANLVRVQRDFGKIKSLEMLEKELLSGGEFSHMRIAKESLIETYRAIALANGYEYYDPNMNMEHDADDSVIEQIEIYKKEIEKCRNAMDRLTELYLYDPEALTKEEFSGKRKELREKMDKLEEEIRNLTDSGENNIADMTFIQDASSFLIAQKILTKKHIDYVSLAMDIDNQSIKDFIDQVIEKIYILDGRVEKIIFENGLVHEFIYERPADLPRCRYCGYTVGTTVGCRVRTISIKGKRYSRIKVGDAKDVYAGKKIEKCDDCGALFGRWHHIDCKNETCPVCGGRLFECEHKKV